MYVVVLDSRPAFYVIEIDILSCYTEMKMSICAGKSTSLGTIKGKQKMTTNSVEPEMVAVVHKARYSRVFVV